MARDLFFSPIGLWEYSDVDAFLQARIPENTTVEYKADHTENVVDTLVAFANGDSPGLIFIGVTEARPHGIPKTWPHLEPGKDQVAPVYSKAAAQTIPLVAVEARTFTDGDSGKQLVAVRVAPGPQPPYFGKERGVKVRSGDQDVDADPRTLERLFARRQDLATVQREHQERLKESLNSALPGNRDQLRFSVRVAPLVTRLRTRFGAADSQALHQLARARLAEPGWRERRFDNRVELTAESGEIVLSVADDGSVLSLVGFPDEPNARLPIPSQVVFPWMFRTLGFSFGVLSSVFGYDGPLYAGILFAGLSGRDIAWPKEQPMLLGRNRADVEPVDTWGSDTTDLRPADRTLPFARTVLKSLAWRLGYTFHEDYIDRWGSARDE